MKKTFFILLTSILLMVGCTGPNMPKEKIIDSCFDRAQQQYTLLIKELPQENNKIFPRGLHQDNTLNLVVKEDWTSGFFPGALWYIYEYTNDKKWQDEAVLFTEKLDGAQHIEWHHDVGFMIQNSYGNGYRLTGNETYKQAVIDAARSLSTRYRPKAKIIQSWDTTPNMGWIATRGWDMPVIIDNMMNLNLLYKAYQHTGDTSFLNIANNHAHTTIENHFRPDFSTYHVVDYNHETGEVLGKYTAQGLYDHSSWARGQAWGLYGYTEAFAATKDSSFLKQANAIAHYIINNPKIPQDAIPYWDYDDPKIPHAPRDASAAAVTASALLDLYQYTPNHTQAYLDYASKILRRLASEEYLAEVGTNGGFLLMHSVGNIHTGEENDRPLNYADYYFLEALLKWKQIN